MSELSRVEDLLATGVEEPVLPMSRLEAILRGEKITPQSRVEELLLQYNPSDILIEKRITANGTYFAVNDNADGYFKVVVDTPVVPPTVLDHLVETITTNGVHTFESEHDGFEDAEITVNVQPSVGTKSIMDNGTYNASDDGWAGYSQVTVNVSGGDSGMKAYKYVQFTTGKDITLPTLAPNDRLTIDYECLSNFNNQHIFGSNAGSTDPHLTQFNNLWYAANGSGSEVNFSGNMLGRHVCIFNKNDHIEFDGTEVSAFSSFANLSYYIGNRGGEKSFGGLIYEVKIERFADNVYETVYDLVPRKQYSDGSVIHDGLYDIVNDTWYEVSGVYCSGGEVDISDDYIYLMDGQVPGNQGTTYLEFDKPPVNGYYVISIYANSKSINHMVYFETGRNSDSFSFSPGSSGSYNCYIMWDNNKATVRIACNSGSWYTMHVRVTRVDDNYILNS